MKAVIFDLDGTMLDSMGMWEKLLPEFMQQWNLVADRRFLSETSELGLYATAQYLIDRHNLSITALDLQERWNQSVLGSYINTVLPKPFVLDYLIALKQRGIGTAMATLTDHAMSDAAVQHHGLAPYLDELLSTEDVDGVNKRRPNLFLEAARRLGTHPSETVVFEDSYYAMVPAKEAGFIVYGIEDPRQSRDKEKIIAICDQYFPDWKSALQALNQMDMHATV